MLYYSCQFSVRTGNPSEGGSFGVGSSSFRYWGGGGYFQKRKVIFGFTKNGIYNFNALRSSNLPTYIIDDKFYLEHTKVVLNRLTGSERGIYALEISCAIH